MADTESEDIEADKVQEEDLRVLRDRFSQLRERLVARRATHDEREEFIGLLNLADSLRLHPGLIEDSIQLVINLPEERHNPIRLAKLCQ
jgi:hypothetical protein